jgi:TolB-like protein/Tfp pilus assembly protein PilF
MPGRRTGAWISSTVAAVLVGGLAVWLWSRPALDTGAVRSLAVLPLENLSGDPEQEYFADGMTEALIGELGRLDGLRVISRTSVMQYKAARRPLPQIASDLGVNTVLEGSVLRSGDRVRITAQLIDARDDRHLWSESYERDLRDVLTLQGDVARTIAVEIDVTLEPRRSAPRINPGAYEAYLKGRYFVERHTAPDTLKALQYFNRAIEADPDSPLAYAGMADAFACSPFHPWTAPRSDRWPSKPEHVMGRAKSAAAKALELDPSVAEAHTALGLVAFMREGDFVTGERFLRAALDLKPGYEFGHRIYAYHLALLGRLDEALREMQRALELDPLSAATNSALGELYEWRREKDLAVSQWKRALDLDPGHPGAHQQRGTHLCSNGNTEEGVAALEKAGALSPDDPLILGDLGYCYGVSGTRRKAEEILQRLTEWSKNEYVSPMSFARVQMGLRNRDQVFEWLERAYEVRALDLTFVGLDRRFDPLHSDPRFESLLRRIGLPARVG